jgi:hypothetical protein
MQTSIRAARDLGIPGVLALAALMACGAKKVSTPTGGAWVDQLGGAGDEFVIDLAVDPGASTVALSRIGGGAPWAASPAPAALGLIRLAPSGRVISDQELPNPHRAEVSRESLAVTPLGDVLLALRAECSASGCLDLGAGALHGSVLMKRGASGSLTWQRPLDGVLASRVAVDSSGNAVVVISAPDGSLRLLKVGPDGEALWEVPAPAASGPSSGGRFPADVAFATNGDVLFASGLSFHRLGAAGSTLWSSALPADATVRGNVVIAGLSDGTVAAAASFCGGAVEYAGVRRASPLGCVALLALSDADGTQRLAIALGGDPTGVIGVAPAGAGQLSVLTTRGACDVVMRTWSTTGVLVREQALGRCALGAGFVASAVASDPDSGHVAIGGGFSGGVDLRDSPLASRGGSDAFVIGLAP